MKKSQTKPSDFEPVDDTPVAIPTRLRLPQSRTDQIRAFIREEMSRAAADQGHETFAEADDLEPDDEEDLPLSPYEELLFEPPSPPIDRQEAVGQAPVDPAPPSEVPPPANPGGSNAPLQP